MLIIPSRSTEDGHISSPWVVCYGILGFLIFKVGKCTFTQGPLPTCTDLFLPLEAPIIVECRELQLHLQSKLPPLKESESPEKHLGIPGVPCCLHCLPPPPTCWARALPHSYLWVQTSSVLPTFLLDAPLPRPQIQSLTLQVVAKDRWALLDPQVCPNPLAFVFFSMMASAIARWPYCMVLMVTSTCAVLLAQLTGPLKLSSMFCALW